MHCQTYRSLVLHSVLKGRLLLAWRAENLLPCGLEGLAEELQGPTVSCSVANREPHPASHRQSAVPSTEHYPTLLAPCWQSWQVGCLSCLEVVLCQ